MTNFNSWSGTSSSVVNKIKQKLEILKLLFCLDSYVKTRPSKSNLGDNLSGEDDLFDETNNQENQNLSNENSEGKVSLASLETNRNKSNQNSCKINYQKPGGKTTNEEKNETVKKSPVKKILKTKKLKFCAVLLNSRMDLLNLRKKINIYCLENMLPRR